MQISCKRIFFFLQFCVSLCISCTYWNPKRLANDLALCINLHCIYAFLLPCVLGNTHPVFISNFSSIFWLHSLSFFHIGALFQHPHFFRAFYWVVGQYLPNTGHGPYFPNLTVMIHVLYASVYLCILCIFVVMFMYSYVIWYILYDIWYDMIWYNMIYDMIWYVGGGRKCETGRCHGEAARSVLAKVRGGNVFARFHPVTAKTSQ
jgi:hypothetical protein